MNEIKFKAAGLWEKTSASGNHYFVGRLGGVRILIFENRERQGDNEPTHHLFFAEAPDKPRSAEQPAPSNTPNGGSRAARNPTRRRSTYRRAAAAPAPAAKGPDPDLNDEIPF